MYPRPYTQESPSPEVCTYLLTQPTNECVRMHAGHLGSQRNQPVPILLTHPPGLQYKVPAQRSFLLVSRNQTILRKARAWAFLMAGIPSGKKRCSEKAADSVFNHPLLPLLFQGLFFSLRGRTIPSWRPCLHTTLCPPTAAPEPSGPDEERGAKGVRSYLLYQGTCLLPR